jgi:phage terminase small subunit
MSSKLTDKQQLFVQEYLVDFNATQAATRAGYSVRTAYAQGHALLKRPLVEKALAVARRQRNQRTQVDQDYVISKLVEVVERAMDPYPVLDRDGMPTGEFKWQGSVANQALALLAKHTGGFGDKADQGDGITVVVDTGVPGPPASQMPLSFLEKEADRQDKPTDDSAS